MAILIPGVSEVVAMVSTAALSCQGGAGGRRAGSTGSWLKLPAEHGATVAFAFSTLLSLWLARGQFSQAALAIALLWLAFLTMHRTPVCLLAGLAGAPAAYVLSGEAGLAAVVALFPLALWLGRRLPAAWGARELVGMTGASLAPLLCSLVLGSASALTACLAMSFAACAGVTAVRYLTGSKGRHLVAPAVLALGLWIALMMVDFSTASWCAFPFVVQIACKPAGGKAGFKTVGAIEALAYLWVTLSVGLRF